jgi:hypothetical protein
MIHMQYCYNLLYFLKSYRSYLINAVNGTFVVKKPLSCLEFFLLINFEYLSEEPKICQEFFLEIRPNMSLSRV